MTDDEIDATGSDEDGSDANSSNANGHERDGRPDGDGEPVGSRFDRELETARDLLEGDEVTAAFVGVVRGGTEVDTTFTRRPDSPREAGLQALSLLAAHVRLVSREAGVDPATVAGDAASLADAVEEIDPETLAAAVDRSGEDADAE